MNEFSLINAYFKSIPHERSDVILGIGDDAACIKIPAEKQLLISSDTLIADVHFLSTWNAYDIAYKAVMVNVSDIAAMGGTPCWLTLALTLPDNNAQWLSQFSEGLNSALQQFNMALVGGDTTRGPVLSITITVHGLVDDNKVVKRSGAQVHDRIYVSGALGGAAFAVEFPEYSPVLLNKLKHPQPRVDLVPCLSQFATAAIDISDGLAADLNHICEMSEVGACLNLAEIPVHPLIKKSEKALDFALFGGDDYELCFTVKPEVEKEFLTCLKQLNITSYLIGVIEQQPGLRAKTATAEYIELQAKGYSHF